MPELTYENLVYFGYNGGMYNEKTKDSKISWNFPQTTRTVLNLKDECIRAAKLIGEKATTLKRKPFVFLSGGIDSEVVCKSFIDAGVSFEAITFACSNNTLEYETKYVDQFVQKNKLKHRYIIADWRAWLKTEEAKNRYIESCATWLTEVPHLKLIDIVWKELNGFPVIGAGDPEVEKIDKIWSYVLRESDSISNSIYCWRKNIEAAPMFFHYTPELVLSFLKEQEFDDLFNGRNKLANTILNNARMIKMKVYKKYWPDLEIKPKMIEYRLDPIPYDLIKAGWNINPTSYRGAWFLPCTEIISQLESKNLPTITSSSL